MSLDKTGTVIALGLFLLAMILASIAFAAASNEKGAQALETISESYRSVANTQLAQVDLVDTIGVERVCGDIRFWRSRRWASPPKAQALAWMREQASILMELP